MRHQVPSTLTLPDDLYDFLCPGEAEFKSRHPAKSPPLIVADDWPRHIPVTETEISLFDIWFGDSLLGTE